MKYFFIAILAILGAWMWQNRTDLQASVFAKITEITSADIESKISNLEQKKIDLKIKIDELQHKISKKKEITELKIAEMAEAVRDAQTALEEAKKAIRDLRNSTEKFKKAF